MELNLGFVALSAFSAPTDLANCTFEGDSNDPPVVGDFTTTIVDATNGVGDPITVTVGVSIAVKP